MYGLYRVQCIVCIVFLYSLFYTYIDVAREFKTLQQGISFHRSWLTVHRSWLTVTGLGSAVTGLGSAVHRS